MSKNVMLASEYAEQIENFVNNWNSETLENLQGLQIVVEEKEELIEIKNETNFGQDTTNKFMFYLQNRVAGGYVWFEKGDDIQEVYRKAHSIMMENTNKRNPKTLSGLVDRFMNDDKYAERLLDDSINGDKFDDLYECIRCGLVERYDELTGNELSDLYQMIITMKVIDKRMKDITGNDDNVCWDGVIDGLFDAQLKGDESPCSDREHFRRQTFPIMVAMAKAKANAMCVRI